MSYHIFYAPDFEKAIFRHGRILRRRLDDALALLQENPFHVKLHTKPLWGPLQDFYSFRLGRDFRVIFIFKSIAEIQLIKCAKRDEIYR